MNTYLDKTYIDRSKETQNWDLPFSPLLNTFPKFIFIEAWWPMFLSKGPLHSFCRLERNYLTITLKLLYWTFSLRIIQINDLTFSELENWK